MSDDEHLESDRNADISDDDMHQTKIQSIKIGHAPLKELKESMNGSRRRAATHFAPNSDLLFSQSEVQVYHPTNMVSEERPQSIFQSFKKMFMKVPVQQQRPSSALENTKQETEPKDLQFLESLQEKEELLLAAESSRHVDEREVMAEFEDIMRKANEFTFEKQVSENRKLEPARSSSFQVIGEEREQYLILIVHGIGTNNFTQVKNLLDMKQALFKVQQKYFKSSQYEFVLKMVDWKSTLGCEDAKRKVSKVSIREAVASVREIFNETAIDILFYMSKSYRTQILERVTQEANKYYNELFEEGKNERFKGKVAFVGHSLGTVIIYDLLSRQYKYLDQQLAKEQDLSKRLTLTKKKTTKGIFDFFENLYSQDRSKSTMHAGVMQKEKKGTKGKKTQEEEEESKRREENKTFQLDFGIEHYFLLGSPLPIFISVYNEEENIKHKLPTCDRFYNIFHPQDVIAYRIEPLFQEKGGIEFDKFPAVLLPYHKNNGYHALNQMGTFFRNHQTAVQQIEELKQSCKQPPPLSKMEKPENYGGTQEQGEEEELKMPFATEKERYDFVLQERTVETLIKPVGLLQSHIRYFVNKDVSYFILKKIHKEDDIPYNL